MSLSSLAFESSLLVRDPKGRYVPATADQILDAARYVVDMKLQHGAAFTSPDIVKEYLGAKLGGFEHQVFAILFLDNQHRLIEYVEMFRGTIGSASVYPREVVKEALRLNAAAAILSHNHPSGHPEPSEADKTMTKRLKAALELVEVRIIDHIIVAGHDRVSFAECGLM
jgi:DNA repair protein RadC